MTFTTSITFILYKSVASNNFFLKTCPFL